MKPIEYYLLQGEQRKWEKADADYGSNDGKLRGGNSGCVTSGGLVLGKCSRLSLLSYLGISTGDFDAHKRRMFTSGFQSEDYIAEALANSDIEEEGYVVLREEECPASWTVTNPISGKEVPASGRPDILVVKPLEGYTPPMVMSSGEVVPATNFQPMRGLELKKISSTWRANRVAIEGDPSTDYVIQAANYSLRFGKIPWTLIFSSYDSHDTYYAYIKHRGADKKIQPQRWNFELTWEGDQLQVNNIPTTVTGRGIDNYYQLLLEMEAAKDTGPRPSKENCIPGGKDQFDSCTNCVFSEVCDQYEDNYDDWQAAARHLMGDK